MRQKELTKNIKREYAKMVFILHSYGLAAKGVRINATSARKSSENIMSIDGKGSVLDNVTDIFGPKQSETLVRLEEFAIGDFSIDGYISTCQHGKGRSKPDRQFFYVNNRPCELTNAAKAINEIFHQYNRYQYPFCAIFLKTEIQGKFDVNLTPDKRKVFIEKEAQIWEVFKVRLSEIFDKLAPPEIISAKVTDFYNSDPISSSTSFEKKTEPFDTKEKICANGKPNHEDEVGSNGDSMNRDYDQPQIKRPKIEFIDKIEMMDKCGTKHDIEKFDKSNFATSSMKMNLVEKQIEDENTCQSKELPSKVELENVSKNIIEDLETEYDEPMVKSRKLQMKMTFSMEKLRQSLEMKTKLLGETKDPRGRQFLTKLDDKAEEVESEFNKHLDKKSFESADVIGQFNRGFIIVKLLDDDLFIVDQHATDEKFRYETFVKTCKMSQQPLGE